MTDLRPGLRYFAISALLILVLGFCWVQSLAAASYRVLDAQERGTFDIGPGISGAYTSFDKDLNREVLEFEYSASLGAYVGVWTKKYPADLKPGAVDAVKIGVKVPDPKQVQEVSVKLEIKGAKAAQSIQLQLKPGWNYIQESVDWNNVGDLTEVAFVVSPLVESEKPLEGLLYFDLEFFSLTFLQKYSTFIKMGMVLVLGFLLTLLTSIFGKLFKRSKIGSQNKVHSGLQRDFLYGLVAVLVVACVFYIYELGTRNPLRDGLDLSFLVLALGGVASGALLKWGLTGKALSSGEVLQNILVGGLLAACSSPLEMLKVPASWPELFMINKVLAALAFTVYHVLNARSLVSSSRHLRVVPSVLIGATPFLLNWLMLSRHATLLQPILANVTGDLISAYPMILELVGRSLILLGFNEALMNGMSILTRGKALQTGKAHGTILLVSLWVSLSPWLADLGSTPYVGSLPMALRILLVTLSSMLSFGGLWAQVYLVTGTLLDSGHRTAPSKETLSTHARTGFKKGMAYSGILVGLLYALHVLLGNPAVVSALTAMPIPLGILSGALVFPLLKTVLESFDGSLPFFARLRYSYQDTMLYARGAVVGFGFAYALTQDLIHQAMPDRILFGLAIGIGASAGVSVLRDAVNSFRNQGEVQSWRLYFVDALLGGFVGCALTFYLDALQVPVIIEKFKLYTSVGTTANEYITYPLLNKWGKIDLGSYTGGAKLLFTESLAGVINWSIAAWLFALNKVFLLSLFERQTAPIKFFFSKDGFAQLVEHMIYVLRWGLWMSPIIFTFLRMMPDPTWYNQDGAIRTLVATYKSVTLSGEAFREWSLGVFVYIMALDFFRVLIWMDHMGLRVATLVNLSFIGLDKLDERAARFIGPAAAQRYIPEAIKRFTTWAPLLIPFYLPRGDEWGYAWNKAEAFQNAAKASGGGILSRFEALEWNEKVLWAVLTVFLATGVSFALRAWHRRSQKRRVSADQLSNRDYRVILKENGEIYSEIDHHKKGVYPGHYDITRRSYDLIDPSGRLLFLVDTARSEMGRERVWPVIGNFSKDLFPASSLQKLDDSLRIANTANGIRTTLEIRLPDQDAAVELWDVTLENLEMRSRTLKMVPYLEWLLNGGLHDRFHTQYARLFAEMEYVSQANAILAWQKSTKSMGILAIDTPAEGFLNSRMDFIGRAQSIWNPRSLDTLDFLPARDTAGYPTFDPIGSLLVDANLEAKATRKFRIMIGYTTQREKALELIYKYLKPAPPVAVPPPNHKGKGYLIGHGEILPQTPQPYYEFRDEGRRLVVHTPFTPRPFDHALSNPLHSVMVTNRGLHTSCNGNSQQNRLTPDWPDTVTKEVPAEAIYLYDPDRDEWFSPTYHPLNQKDAKHTCEFGVDGTAVFHMTRGTVSTELTVFVPPEDPLGVYYLTLKNMADYPRRFRVAPFFQVVLEFQPERSGSLQTRCDRASSALYFYNPRNMFRTGWAFAATSLIAEGIETQRGRFFGTDRAPHHPYMVENNRPDTSQTTDERQIASFVGTVEVPVHGEVKIAFVLGQTEDWKQAHALVQKYRDIASVEQSLQGTRTRWLDLMKTAGAKTTHAHFDALLNWLKYQALAERIWARRGFYQTSGAYGFRDQLQDTVNLMWVDPNLARKQILLHASQQFIQGDVFHWFFTLPDGRTSFSCRSHASDNPVWLSWAVVEYVRATGDETLLDEKTSYVYSEFPFADLPKNKDGWGHHYHRSTRMDTVYKHCLRSLDLILNRRMGRNGLPLIRTGDWNDGLDEIGSHGKGESVWLGFFVYYILKGLLGIVEKKEGPARRDHYAKKMRELGEALEKTWREDRYLRAIHDDGTEIGVKGSGIWEVDALTAAWAVIADINFERARKAFDTALGILEKENAILLGWPALREDTKPYLGRSSKYPEGVRENGMYCHGEQWLVRAARILAEKFEKLGDEMHASQYRATSYRLWLKISPISHVAGKEIEIYGGQPNKQAADILTNFDPGRMIWHGYTGAAGWMLRQAFEGVVGASLLNNKLVLPSDLDKPRGELKVLHVYRDLGGKLGKTLPVSGNGGAPLPKMAAPVAT